MINFTEYVTGRKPELNDVATADVVVTGALNVNA